MKRSIRDALRRAEATQAAAADAAVAETQWLSSRPVRPVERGLLRQARWCVAIVEHAARAPVVRT